MHNYEAGREVHLSELLKHKLQPVPLALADITGKLRSSSKAILCDILTKEIVCPPTIRSITPDIEYSIDGQALIIRMGMPKELLSFGDFANYFLQCVLNTGEAFHTIHVLFDRYKALSIKNTTRERHYHNKRAIRRVITNEDIQLPHDWSGFLKVNDNKTDSAKCLSNHLICNAPANKIIIVAGGFSNDEQAECLSADIDSNPFSSNHEEADTQISFHCAQTHSQSVVVSARDTDILVLLVVHFNTFPCQ